MKGKLIKVLEHYHLYDGDKAIATTIVGNPMLLPNLSLKNCQAIERGYDLDELANKYGVDHMNDDIYFSFIAGFQKALEILGDKKFSEEDVRNAIQIGRENSSLSMSWKEIIQSLQQTEWDVEIVEQCLDPTCDGVNRKGECITTGKPKLDADGCLILKRVV